MLIYFTGPRLLGFPSLQSPTPISSRYFRKVEERSGSEPKRLEVAAAGWVFLLSDSREDLVQDVRTFVARASGRGKATGQQLCYFQMPAARGEPLSLHPEISDLAQTLRRICERLLLDLHRLAVHGKSSIFNSTLIQTLKTRNGLLALPTLHLTESTTMETLIRVTLPKVDLANLIAGLTDSE
jgi:hypothetical protein